jgi:DNA helicase II / ATP-dependent DNA helicase PcrA
LFVMSTNSDKSLFDKTYLKKLFATKNVNVSALNNYIECPNKYLFRNLINLPDVKSTNLIFGDVMHNSLEKFFEESRNNKKIASKSVLIKYFKNIMEKSELYGAEYERYLERGEEALGEYYEHYHKNWTTEIENEKYIKTDFKLDDGEVVNLSGRLDKIEFLDSPVEGKINIIDYKTGRTYSDKAKALEKEALKRQLVFYYILYENYADNKFRINQAVLDFIEKNKDDKFEQYSVPISTEEIREVKSEINKMVSEVMSGEFLSLGCDRRDCEYCNYRKLIS